MHDYLRAIGFSKIKTKKDMKEILDMVIAEPTQEFITDNGVESALGEKSRDFGKRLGITVRGEYDDNGEFEYDYYFPYFQGNYVTTKEEVVIEKHADREDYVGMCDEVNVGISLIFHLLNMANYIDCLYYEKEFPKVKPIILSGLSLSGKVIFPTIKNEAQVKKRKVENSTRNSMIAAARQGDQEAIDNLTLEDIDLYTSISRRAKTEDVLSIVESYVMPYGISCDEYSIMGSIIDYEETLNQQTGEELYLLTIDCNDLVFDICINRADLLGEPMAGRRFKGSIWMQGNIEFLIDE